MRRDILSKSKNFVFKGKNIKGDKVRGNISGLNKEIIYKELELKGIFIEKITRDYHIIKTRKIKIELLLNFIEEWYNLEITNLTTQDCLEIIKENSLNKKLKTVLTDILANANAGMTLHECFREYNEYFPEIFLNQIVNGIRVGNIIDTLRGLNGFGYDPLFVPCGYDITFAEMPPEEKNKISHRAVAIQKLIEYLLGK